MAKETNPEPGFNMQPPPYSEVAPPHSIPPQVSVQPVSVPVYPPHHHRGQYGSESVVQTHIVTRQPGATVHVVTSSPLFGPNPRTMLCTSCNQTVSSKIIQEPSIRTHVLALSLCLLGCWPCVPCVYCASCCMNVNHYCTNCNAYQGTFIATY